jgi:hypothetical protein
MQFVPPPLSLFCCQEFSPLGVRNECPRLVSVGGAVSMFTFYPFETLRMRAQLSDESQY